MYTVRIKATGSIHCKIGMLLGPNQDDRRIVPFTHDKLSVETFNYHTFSSNAYETGFDEHKMSLTFQILCHKVSLGIGAKEIEARFDDIELHEQANIDSRHIY